MPEIRVAWTWNSTSPLHVGSGLSRPGVADNLVQRDHEGNPIIPGEAVKGALRMAAEQVAAWLGEPQDYSPRRNTKRTSPGNSRDAEDNSRDYSARGTAEPTSRPLARLFGGEGAARCTAATLVAEPESKGNGSGSHRRSPPGERPHVFTSTRARLKSGKSDLWSAPPGERPHVFTSTAIDRATGTARDNTLRKTEFVPRGRQFEAQYTANVAVDEIEEVETLLLAALAAVESVGGKAGIGWGRVELVSVSSAVVGVIDTEGERPRKPADAVTPKRLEKLRSALSCTIPLYQSATAVDAGVPSAPRTASGSTQTGPPSSRQWFKLTIDLQEPTCLPSLPEFSNQVTTQDSIPATTLRGALAGYWRRSGRSEADVRSWLSDTTVWTPALRSVDGAPAVPAPRSFVTTKRAHGKVSPVHDTFRPQAPTTKDGEPLQWRSLAGGTIRWNGSQAVVAEPAKRATRMHVARDYRTGSKQTGALYARESLAPGTRFVAWAHVPPAAFPGVTRPGDDDSAATNKASGGRFELLIGKRLSAGNGRATVHVEDAEGPESFARADDAKADSCDVFVQLLSPAVVYDPDGYPRRTVNRDWWASEFGGEGADEIVLRTDAESDRASRTAPGRRGGWMGTWRHARAAVTTIDSGSVWRLRCSTQTDAERLRQRLRARGRIGERAHEGFGWIAVDPPWLGREGTDKLDAPEAEPPQPKGHAMPWPGVTISACTLAAHRRRGARAGHLEWPGVTISACTLAGIARGLAEEEVTEETARAYQEIAARIRVAPEDASAAEAHLNGLKDLCAERARRRESKWKPVDELLSQLEPEDVGERANSLEHYKALRERLLFTLGILITRGTAARLWKP